MTPTRIASIVSKAPPDIRSGEFNPEEPCSIYGWPSVTHFRANEFSFPWHRGPALLAFTFSGVCFGQAEGAPPGYGDQCSAILLGEEPRRFGKAGNTTLEQVVFFFPREFIRASLEDLNRPLFRALEPSSEPDHSETKIKLRPELIRNSAGMKKIARTVREAILSGCAQPHQLEELRIELFAQVAVHQGLSVAPPEEKRQVNEELSRRLLRVRELIHDLSHEKLLLGDLARYAGVSPFHFLREFKRKFGATPNQMQTQVRLDRAKRLLQSQHESVTSTCFTVGYESLGTFSSLFRRELGVSPNEYQRLKDPSIVGKKMPDLNIPNQFWVSALATESVAGYAGGDEAA